MNKPSDNLEEFAPKGTNIFVTGVSIVDLDENGNPVFTELSNNLKIDKNIEMEKYEIFLIGKKTTFAFSEDEAIKNVEEELKMVHTNFNIEISGIKKVEE